MNVLSAIDVMPSAFPAVLTTTIKPKVNQNVICAIVNEWAEYICVHLFPYKL